LNTDGVGVRLEAFSTVYPPKPEIFNKAIASRQESSYTAALPAARLNSLTALNDGWM